jgi:hypothetical protein
MMDAMLIKHLSRLCANIAQFRHEEYLERLVASMRRFCVRRKSL